MAFKKYCVGPVKDLKSHSPMSSEDVLQSLYGGSGFRPIEVESATWSPGGRSIAG
jgi:hypothetical protein